MIASLILNNPLMAATKLNTFPEALYVHADNTYKESKNTIALFSLAWLLAVLEGTRLRECHLVFLMVGHTHDQVDAYFGLIGRVLRNMDR